MRTKKKTRKQKTRLQTTLSPSCKHKWKRYWQSQKEVVKDSEAEDAAEDKGPTVLTGATGVANWDTSANTAPRPTRHHLEAEEAEEEAVTIPPHI